MRNVVGLFLTREEAEAAIHRLKDSGVPVESIGVALKHSEQAHDLAKTTGVGDLTAEGAAAGAVSGAAVGTLVGLALLGSTFVLPGIGTFLIAGPIAAALTGAGVGAASGSLLGGLVGSGIPEHEAGHYVSGIERGEVVVTAGVPDDLEAATRRVFDEEGSRRTFAA